jgi:hypothetical protein
VCDVMVGPYKYIFLEDAAEEAQAETGRTGRQHFVYYDPPRFTGPAGACYYVSDNPGDTGTWFLPEEIEINVDEE